MAASARCINATANRFALTVALSLTAAIHSYNYSYMNPQPDEITHVISVTEQDRENFPTLTSRLARAVAMLPGPFVDENDDGRVLIAIRQSDCEAAPCQVRDVLSLVDRLEQNQRLLRFHERCAGNSCPEGQHE